jgi:cyclase
VKVPVVASGGAGTLEHFYEGVVKGGAQILLAASVFHFRTIRIKEVKEYLRVKGLKVIL